MKKIYIYIGVFTFGIIAATAFVVVNKNLKKKEDSKESFAALLERHGPISTTSEWINTKAAIQGLQAQIRRDPTNVKAKLLLALAYMQEARVTGEHPYYYPAALDLIDDVLDSDPEASIKFQATVAKATVQLSLHQFSNALETGKEALAINPHNAAIYGVLCDANVELGNYDEAVKMADKMVSIRPDLRSYSRISYLREIHGNMPGAIEAMKLAVTAGYPGLENTSWTRITLGQLYEKTGDLANAEVQYRIALQETPHYAFALAGLGRLDAKKKDYKGAIKLFSQAGEVIPEFSFQEELVTLYRETGKRKEAEATSEKLIEMLKEDSEAGHDVDLELANIYMELFHDYDKALDYANEEYNRRPNNIDVNKTMAAIYYKKQDLTKASQYLKTATKTNNQDPSLLCLSGLINFKKGDKTNGITLIKKSFQMNPFQDDEFAQEGKKIMITPMVN